MRTEEESQAQAESRRFSQEIESTVRDGDRIAQVVIARLADVAFEETAEELSETSRGSGGHGSTGR